MRSAREFLFILAFHDFWFQLEVIEAHINQLTSLVENIREKHAWEAQGYVSAPSSPQICKALSEAGSESSALNSIESNSNYQVSASASPRHVNTSSVCNQNENSNVPPSQRIAEIEIEIESLELDLQKVVSISLICLNVFVLKI